MAGVGAGRGAGEGRRLTPGRAGSIGSEEKGVEHANEIRPSPQLVQVTREGIEIWLPVPNTDGWYDVSNLGRVRSWVNHGGRNYARTRTEVPTILVACPNRAKNPYLCVTVFVGKIRRYVPVHNLVCEAFIGPRPGSVLEWEAGHDDDDKANNRLDNLKWCTKLANARDAVKNGRTGGSQRPVREVDGVKHYCCTGCEEWKPEEDFGRISKSIKSRCGRQSECRKCSSARRRESKRRKRAAA